MMVSPGVPGLEPALWGAMRWWFSVGHLGRPEPDRARCILSYQHLQRQIDADWCLACISGVPALALPKIRRARIDHAAGAAEAGLPLRPTEYRHPLRLHLGFEPVHCVHRLV